MDQGEPFIPNLGPTRLFLVWWLAPINDSEFLYPKEDAICKCSKERKPTLSESPGPACCWPICWGLLMVRGNQSSIRQGQRQRAWPFPSSAAPRIHSDLLLTSVRPISLRDKAHWVCLIKIPCSRASSLLVSLWHFTICPFYRWKHWG